MWRLCWDSTLLSVGLPFLCVLLRTSDFFYFYFYFFNVSAVTFQTSSWINQHFSSVGEYEKSAALLWLWINSYPERLFFLKGIILINTENILNIYTRLYSIHPMCFKLFSYIVHTCFWEQGSKLQFYSRNIIWFSCMEMWKKTEHI